MFIRIMLSAVFVVLTACGDDSSTPDATDSTQSTTSLSATFKTTCSTCHGASGADSALTNGKVLKGTSLTATEFRNTVRSGRGGMSSYTTGQYSDADLAADYQVLAK